MIYNDVFFDDCDDCDCDECKDVRECIAAELIALEDDDVHECICGAEIGANLDCTVCATFNDGGPVCDEIDNVMNARFVDDREHGADYGSASCSCLDCRLLNASLRLDALMPADCDCDNAIMFDVCDDGASSLSLVFDDCEYCDDEDFDSVFDD